MSQNFYDTWKPTVERVARFVAHDFPDVEPDDLAQDLYVEVLERGWREPDGYSMSTILTKVAKDRAMQYRAEHLILSPQYNYRTSDVRRILPKVFSYDDWVKDSSFTDNDPEGPVAPSRGGEPSYDITDRMVEYTDIKRAWERLPLNYRKLIFMRYALGDEPEGESEARQTRRAVERLTDLLNTYHPTRHEGPGGRRLLSSAHERYIISTANDDA